MKVKLTIPIPKGIEGVVFSDEIGDTPANCNLRTRIVKLNPEYWKKLNDDQRFYVMAHEAGHINLQTRSEFEADEYASKLYLESGRSPKQSVFAISKVLPLTNYEQRKRLEHQLERASEYDFEINKNTNALKNLKIMNENIESELDEFESNYYGDDELDEGFGGKFAKRRAEKRDEKKVRKADKNERKNTKSASKATAREKRSEAKVIKATNGDSSGSAGDVFGKAMEGLRTVGNTVGAIKGERPSMEGMPDPDGAGGEDTSKKILGLKATTFYIVAGITAAVVIVGLWLAFKPKKEKKAA